ncbi:Methyltransferase domain-containing protein [Methanolobus vulcani]|jgi:2-polyprenyl-3-methyl-5-hydroxy-6-metoxy-1,4-benzoquinol methylase|uniref:Methyltransferase domain-containing protein n=1 Tax=Methanolobus vulcani TaxID=38026 RepID=A0A7Z7AY28_9EURY|nr:class I SAM-dependent methyltransferase [Methanolobus vulcani]SDF57734.1 Methyltransferase domain-containing protein [Methanolobus vulcani]
MAEDSYKVIKDSIFQHKHLDPVPRNEELTDFYQSKYFDLIRKGGRAPEIRRLMAGGETAEQERNWLRNTLYSDISYVLGQNSLGNRVLDIGCGTGDLVAFLKENGYDAHGIEPSSDAVEIALSNDLCVYNSTLEDYVAKFSQSSERYDAVTLMNVLEHVPDPSNIMECVKKILKPDGIICVRVPNDYNGLQLAAQKKLNKEPWWIAVPDHINYFDFKSLRNFFEHMGFEVFYEQSDFPMELFLLMGDDYVNDPELGSVCHKKRVSFETAVPRELRRQMYRSMADLGLGRCCLTFGRKSV